MKQQRRKPNYGICRGFLIPMGFPVACFESGLNYTPQSGDNFIVTYPKCGTTWAQHIVWMLQNDGQALPLGKNINLEVPHLEEVGAEFVAAIPSPRFIKTHLPYSFTPYSPDAKYIYIARNPFDCVVSFYYHTQGFVKHYDFADGTFDEFFELFIEGEVDWGDYFDHLLSWYEHRHQPNILFTTYEAMKKDPKQQIIEMAKFLGNSYLEKVKNLEILHSILEHTSFTKMSQEQSRWSSLRSPEMTPFIRKGEIGDWQNHFSQNQVARLTDKFRKKTAGIGIENLWPELIPISMHF
ncbi:MAG TPA: sulfotransferase [Cyanobacteria bacterium UBA11149]|nr:sulfotransferase [Cyanobacteria bacterium UBA11367]HBE57381.1 sulfotransferase [Cyanobacteria bacterium UBA11366]HBK66897.1 sulfotransferase [Cyanobacteria bacterium UBA11166]HBR73456.1 sulfotransferase [Cyanobacteria bacterium UBA11159]HBS69710.1 sulfotransferase [Cyanobacteria bacterium UBA11153]HBW88390.1 sulfotransferase [Cyanobacteria bacterium UBA11149]HCA95493.1 sulfotransferase [Cyanobacteria bacterium UBA9226]